MNGNKYQMIIPSTLKDYERNRRDFDTFFECLPIYEIIVIGPREVAEAVAKEAKKDARIRFMDENGLIPMKDIMESLGKRLAIEGLEMSTTSKPGWYYQQFLKMQYARVCPDAYYISWDADTVPTGKIDMFDEEGNPFFDVKPEYNEAYFHTLQSLFGMGKVIEESFISEHMIFSVSHMKEMIEEIEATSLEGAAFYEKIFSAIQIQDFAKGFSEFETFGTWMAYRYPEVYTLRAWSSMRMAGYFFDPLTITKEDIAWLSQDFDALTFESYNQYIPQLAEFFHNEAYRATMSPGTIYRTFLASDLMKNADKDLPN